ncbi:endonuclease/exonuclease/phosphatase family protein [Pelodictyon luteolum]|nr:endonuclease/exonuclease/phosphatase family protein [Pelodictyon luteolum]
MTMKKILSAFLLLSLLHGVAKGGEKTVDDRPESLLLLWWNVENLFDTTDDPGISDEEFTPEGRLHWTPKKLLLKEMRIAYVMQAIATHPDYGQLPAVLAFAEVENGAVFRRALQKIKGARYRALYHDSPDLRGIDIALAYDPERLDFTGMKTYSVPQDGRPTRDIIVAGFKNRGRPFTLILNHWPSRAFGSALTEKKRIMAARVARAAADSLLLQNPDADIIVMGDFNDSPQDRSVRRTLRGTLNRLQAQRAKDGTLYNCWGGSSQPGSYSYRGQWERIDQILVSKGMLSGPGIRTDEPGAFSCFFFRPMFTKSGKKPWRTYEGGKYSGGYSDHLPLLLKVATTSHPH